MEFYLKDKDVIHQVGKALDLAVDYRSACLSSEHKSMPVMIIMNAPLWNAIASEHRAFYQPNVFKHDYEGRSFIFGVYIMVSNIVNKNEIVII